MTNWTLPVGAVDPDVACTCAVKLTHCPNTDGFADDTTLVVVLAA